ncbi:type III secretion system gatekeeper subunit SctW [Pseudomonas batumici]|uniref:type III secretion system gatekeeper subunit SctW n=1 Tax=Pseudomonas batumici TaxID=226910 RepID=UPI0030D4B7B8
MEVDAHRFQAINPASVDPLGNAGINEELDLLMKLATPDHLSLMHDMKEELSMLMSKFGGKRVTENREQDARRALSKVLQGILEPAAVERIGKLHEAANDPYQTTQGFLSLARGLFGDPSDLALALAELLRHWRLSDATRKRIEKARERLLAEEGEQRIHAGINAASKSRHFGKQLGLTPQSLREAYRAFVTGDYCEVAQYEYLLEAFGFDERYRAIDFLQEALALDISATDPSCSQEEFGLLLDRLFALRLIRSADLTFLRCMARYEGPAWEPAQNQQLLNFMLKVLQNPEAIRAGVAELFERLLRFSRRAVLARFIQQLIRGFTEIPEQVHTDSLSRDTVLNGLLALADEIRGDEDDVLEVLHAGF